MKTRLPSAPLNGIHSPTKPGPRKTKPQLFKLALQCLATVALLALLAGKVDLTQVLGLMSRASPFPMLLACLLISVGAPVLGAVQLRLILAGIGHQVAFSKLWRIDLGALYYGSFLPGGVAGGAIRWYRLGTLLGERYTPTAALIASRLLQTISTVGLGFLCWFPSNRSGNLHPALFLLALVPLVLGALLLFHSLSHRLVLRTARRFLKESHVRRVEQLTLTLETLTQAGSRYHLGLLLFSVFRQSLNIVGAFLVANSLGLTVPVMDLGWVDCVSSVLTWLPLTISGLGLREAGYVTLLGLVGVNLESALALSLLLTVLVFLRAVPGAILEFGRSKRTDLNQEPLTDLV